MSLIVAVKSELNSESKSDVLMTSANSDEVLIAMFYHGKAKGTIKTYSQAVNSFLSFCGVGIREIKLEHLMGFKSHLEGRGLSPNSVKVRISAVKSLLSFAQKIGYTSFNVGAVVKSGKTTGARVTRMIEKQDVVKLLSVVWDERDSLLLETIYRLGLRVSEAVKLNVSDLYQQGGKWFVQVLGKGQKYRYLPLPEDLATRMNAIASPESGIIFQSRYGNYLDPSQVHRNLKAYAKKAGVTTAISPHWLRHSHATQALDNGCDIKLLSTSLGHSSIATTSIYLHSRPESGSGDFVSI